VPEGGGSDRTLRENLARLAAVNPALAAAVRSAPADPRLVYLPSRSGAAVPAVRSGSGTAPLHSLYDPVQESRRLVDAERGAGFLAICGLGGGFHVAAALEDPRTFAVLVIEKDPAVLRSLFTHLPYERLLGDPRVSITVGLAEIRRAILAGWKPALMGGMRMLPLRSWCELEKVHFDAAASEVRAAIEAVRADYSVQAHFGKRWFTNMLANIPRVRGTRTPSGAAAAVVTAAGPSLEDHLAALSLPRRGAILVATDTSLPALLRSGIQPDAVLSIDCQVYGYHHFLQGLPDRTALYLDLASPPLLARRFPAARFVAGGHPFARYIDARWMRLPEIDTSGGNVTHSAVTLALGLGARRIEVFGADFAYPGAKAYARGTYLYDFFQAGQCRTSPSDSELVSFALKTAVMERRDGKAVYSTALMTGYRARFQELMSMIHARSFARRFEWPEPGPAPTPPDWKEFLSDYADRLQSLPAPGPLSATDETWGTILPAAARAVKDGSAPGAEALQEARRWSLEQVRRALQVGPAGTGLDA
jgi:hypothetical protein